MNTQIDLIKAQVLLMLGSLADTVAAAKKRIGKDSSSPLAKLMKVSLASVMLLSSGLLTSPAHALPKDPPEQTVDCLGDLQGSISTKDQSVNLWETSILSWNVNVPRGCTGVKLYVDGVVVSPIGSRSIQPIANTVYRLQAVFRNGRREVGLASIKVVLPENLTISANYLAPQLVQALEEGKVKSIFIENHVELDLSGYEGIAIGAGVTLAGGRTVREPGPRLYTTTRPRMLFDITGDNVRITGVRIEGADMGVAEGDTEGVGIFVQPTVDIHNVEIDHNELSGWSWAAVQVWDGSEKIDYVTNSSAVRIHDNFIHHNQHINGDGYGVAVGYGAYALIERNVFDYNRHAISGEDGREGSGYLAYRNLVLENGGLQDKYLGFWTHTHQFDMHARNDCFPWHYNCGPAGEYMDIRYNSFFYTEEKAFKLRGTPAIGADVIDNVFAHAALFTTVVQLGGGATQVIPGALAQNESGLHASNNLVGVNGMNELGSCDFDGDGLNDLFLATGQTWWYSSGGDQPWVYLNTSKKRRAEVTLGFFDGDNRCDVLVDGVIYPGGKTPKSSVNTPLFGGVASATLGN